MYKLSLISALIALAVIFTACPPAQQDIDDPMNTNTEEEKESITYFQRGGWCGFLYIDSTNINNNLPFTFTVKYEYLSTRKDTFSYVFMIRNGDERIEVRDIVVKNDSVTITLPVFGSQLIGKMTETTIEGYWYNYNKGNNYKIPFKAYRDKTSRRFVSEPNNTANDISGNRKTTFSPGTEDAYPALAIFEQRRGRRNGNLKGTFLTETGDYRYLEGFFDGNSLALSAFDGAHAFLFKGKFGAEGKIIGEFWSGSHWYEKWEASQDDDFELTDMKTLTKLQASKFNFSLPNEQGEMISLSDERYKDKVVIVQILGTWCPNCMDETRDLVKLYETYKDQGLEIIGIDFEPRDDKELFQKNIQRLKADLGVEYEMVFGGKSNKKEAAKVLPALEHIMSYPTTLFIDRSGKVQEIHTGYYGPSTGEYHTKLQNEIQDLISNLL